ncbi:MAG TPA: helix-turn-helix transcriptional regulator [Phytomonospora sp.]
MADTALAAQQVYARMREEGTTFAASTVDIPAEQVPAVRRHLASLGLLDAAAEISVDAMAALGRLLADNRERVAELAERVADQQRAAAELSRHYLAQARSGEVEVLSRDDRPRLEQVLDELNGLTRERILELHPPSEWSSGGYLRTPVQRRDTVALGNGAGIRTLHAQITLNNPDMRHHLLQRAEAGVDVRYAPMVPTRMVIFDRLAAIVEGDRDRPGAWAVVVRDSHLVAPLAALHEYCWLTASEAADVPSSVPDARLTEQQRMVLRLLGTGAKDDAIARALGVSTRTVTRIVGELTALLGAGSRFQAGVRAARVGWLD